MVQYNMSTHSIDNTQGYIVTNNFSVVHYKEARNGPHCDCQVVEFKTRCVNYSYMYSHFCGLLLKKYLENALHLIPGQKQILTQIIKVELDNAKIFSFRIKRTMIKRFSIF